MVCATLERFLLIANVSCAKFLYSLLGRKIIITIVVVVAIGLRGVCYWEYEIVVHEYCQAMQIYWWNFELTGENECYKKNAYYRPTELVLTSFSFPMRSIEAISSK